MTPRLRRRSPHLPSSSSFRPALSAARTCSFSHSQHGVSPSFPRRRCPPAPAPPLPSRGREETLPRRLLPGSAIL
ncbi:hypothetical protein ACP4OV_020894 [Aristida adscensionis]